jgi:hypothetical protein
MKKISLMLAAIMLSACSMAGSGNIKWNNARQLHVGMSKYELTSQMGSPYSVSSKSDGTEIWVWVNVDMLFGTQSMSVILKEDKVITVPIIPNSF